MQEILPICSICKKIRDDEGYWQRVDHYFSTHSEVKFSHGMCESCLDEWYGNEEWYKKNK